MNREIRSVGYASETAILIKGIAADNPKPSIIVLERIEIISSVNLGTPMCLFLMNNWIYVQSIPKIGIFTSIYSLIYDIYKSNQIDFQVTQFDL